MHDRHPNRVRPPTLAGYLRAARNARGLSRDQLASAAAISSSYIAQLETGEKAHPTATALSALAGALGLGPVELRHAYNLARLPPAELSETPDDRQPEYLITPEMRMAIDHLDPCLAAYLDERWNVLAANHSYANAFPGLLDSGNILHWLFTCPAAKQILVEWETEAALTVHWFRGLMGAHPDDPWSADLLGELAHYPEFVALWTDERVAFGRDQPYMHLLDPITGERYTVNVQYYSVLPAGRTPVHIHIGVPVPRST